MGDSQNSREKVFVIKEEPEENLDTIITDKVFDQSEINYQDLNLLPDGSNVSPKLNEHRIGGQLTQTCRVCGKAISKNCKYSGVFLTL